EALIEVESAKVPFGAGVLGLAPVSALFRKAEHDLHGSAAPAAAAVTAIAVAGAGWLGVMSNRAGTHVLASRATAPAIVTTTPSPPGAPNLTGISPTSGAAGTQVRISGSSFSGATSVQFGGSRAAGFTVNSPTVITATAPGGSGGVAVRVTGPGGTSQSAQFTYVGPSVTALAPMFGGAGTSVTISGNNLSGALAVSFGTTPATSFKVDSDTSITAVAPASGGTVDITVSNVAGVSGTGRFDRFRYQAPSISGLSPASGNGGTSVTISGTNLTGAT